MTCENCANAYDEGYQAGHNAENARLREQADLLADALDKALFFAGERTSKLAQTRLSTCDTVLRAYREANRE
jgi:hypothetical protein